MGAEKHTPGPWRWEQSDNTTWKVVSDDYGTIVNIHQYPDKHVMPDELCEANAALIAAAPALLEACKKAVPELRCMYQQLTGNNIDSVNGGSVRSAVDAITMALREVEA